MDALYATWKRKKILNTKISESLNERMNCKVNAYIIEKTSFKNLYKLCIYF